MSKTRATTTTGYINRNRQRNDGPTGKPGNHWNQREYAMTCLGCGNKYGANGADVHLRRCPKPRADCPQYGGGTHGC